MAPVAPAERRILRGFHRSAMAEGRHQEASRQRRSARRAGKTRPARRRPRAQETDEFGRRIVRPSSDWRPMRRVGGDRPGHGRLGWLYDRR